MCSWSSTRGRRTSPRGLEIVKAENEPTAIIGRKVDLGEFHMLNCWIRKDVLIEAVDEYVAS